MILQQASRHFALSAASLAMLVAMPVAAQDGNPRLQAELGQLQAQVAALQEQVLALRLTVAEMEQQLAQIQANPLGTSDDLVIGNPRLRSITIQSRGGRIVFERRGVTVSGDILTLDGKNIALDATGKIDISGTPVNVKASPDTVLKGKQIKSN